MKSVFAVIALLLVVYVAVNRERLYLRDPLGAAYRDGAKQEGAEVFINYSNDVLVQVGHHMQMEEYLVQEWNGVPGVPAELKCLQAIVCLSSADHAPMEPLPGATKATMTNREVTFKDGAGSAVRVTLR